MFSTEYCNRHIVHLFNPYIFLSSILISLWGIMQQELNEFLVYYFHFLGLLCLETIRPFSITKTKHNYNSEKYVIRYYVCISPYLSRENWIDVYFWVFQNMGFSITEQFHGFISQLAWIFYHNLISIYCLEYHALI